MPGVWEWSARRDEVKVSGNVEAALGLNPGELNTKVEDFCLHIHPADRERFRLSLVSNEERNDGQMRCVFRLRHADNSYRWFEVEASSIPSQDGRTVKSVGLLRDVTDMKRSQERLMTDAVKCSLTDCRINSFGRPAWDRHAAGPERAAYPADRDLHRCR